MNDLRQVANGLEFGLGLILISAIMKVLFHMGFCG